jgi:TPR repeat protein
MKPALTILLFALSLSSFSQADETNATASLFGIDVMPTVPKAEQYFQEGAMYHAGDGVEQNAAKAVDYFKKAAELGHAQAQYNLALCCMNGIGTEQSDTEAVKWLKKAAEQGIAEAYYPLGYCYYNLEQYTEAYAWALFAEAAGDTRLKETLAPMYSEEEIAAGQKMFAELKKATEKKEQ